MPKIVFFDLDGTLIDNPSSEKRFFFWLLTHGYLKPKQIFLAIEFFFRWLPKYKKQIFVKNKAWLTDLKIDEITSLAENFTEVKLLKSIRPKIKDILDDHLAKGDHVVLLTGTIEYIAKFFAKYLGVHEVYNSVCANDGTFFLNLPLVKHPYGEEKLHIAKKVCENQNIDIKNTIAYGNSIHDVILLEAVGEAFAVTPDKRLRERAQQNNWQIIDV